MKRKALEEPFAKVQSDVDDNQPKEDVRDTSKRQGWLDIQKAIKFFTQDFLAACIQQGGAFKKETWHAVFAFGTIVRIHCPDDIDDSWTFDVKKDEFREEYPFHRFKCGVDSENALAEAQQDYDRVLKTHATRTQEIKAAYRKFTRAGYALPGGEEADAFSTVLSKKEDSAATTSNDISAATSAATTASGDISAPTTSETKAEECLLATFVGSDPHIMTLSIGPSNWSLFGLTTEGKEKRRLDFMFPRLVALIDRHGNITPLE